MIQRWCKSAQLILLKSEKQIIVNIIHLFKLLGNVILNFSDDFVCCPTVVDFEVATD